MLKVRQFAFGPFGVSTFIVFDTDTRDGIVIDPGMLSEREQGFFDQYIAKEKISIRQIVNTHLHLDHCFGNNYVRDKYGVKTAASQEDAFLGKTLAEQARQFGIFADDMRPVEIDIRLKDGDQISIGSYKLKVIEVPGHSPGSIALYSPESSFIIVGDALFKGSIGRTDLPGGSHAVLIKSIGDKLLPLPDTTMVLPGHGPATTIGEEKYTNHFIR